MSADPQLRLALPPQMPEGDLPLIPARMVNEWTYCPRLAYLEGSSGFRVERERIGVEVESSEMEVDGGAEPVSVSVAAS